MSAVKMLGSSHRVVALKLSHSVEATNVVSNSAASAELRVNLTVPSRPSLKVSPMTLALIELIT